MDRQKISEIKLQIVRLQSQYRLTLDHECIDALCLHILYGLEMGSFLTSLKDNYFVDIEKRMHPVIRPHLTSYLSIMTLLKQKYGEQLDIIRE